MHAKTFLRARCVQARHRACKIDMYVIYIIQSHAYVGNNFTKNIKHNHADLQLCYKNKLTKLYLSGTGVDM